jgi:hypothetical protein
MVPTALPLIVTVPSGASSGIASKRLPSKRCALLVGAAAAAAAAPVGGGAGGSAAGAAAASPRGTAAASAAASAGSTKNASPASPSRMTSGVRTPLTCTSTSRSRERNSLNLPKRTWKGVQRMEPSSWRTAMMSSAPDSVALLMSNAALT